jgi:hypothetical protein
MKVYNPTEEPCKEPANASGKGEGHRFRTPENGV